MQLTKPYWPYSLLEFRETIEFNPSADTAKSATTHPRKILKDKPSFQVFHKPIGKQCVPDNDLDKFIQMNLEAIATDFNTTNEDHIRGANTSHQLNYAFAAGCRVC